MLKKIVLTGAAGRLGSYLREPLTGLCEELVSTDIVDTVGTLYSGEKFQPADLSDLSAMEAVTKDADCIVHFGAIGDEAPFDDILQSNIIGAYNVWEAAARNGVRRVVYASSIHAVWMHETRAQIGIDAPHRPDTYYGLAKCFAEDLASLYWDKKQVESVCMRILSCAQVTNVRALGTWLSYDDLIQLVTKSIKARATGFSVVYGVSDNDRCPVDNSAARHLGYRPRDNAEKFATQIEENAPAENPQDPAVRCVGGPFASVELGFSGTAGMNIIDDRKKV